MFFDYHNRIVQLMEGEHCETSNAMLRNDLKETTVISVKGNQIGPIELLEKELDVQHGTTNYKHDSHQVTVQADSVFLPSKDAKKTLETVIHARAVYSLGTFLQTVELVGEESPSFVVKKQRSFPWSKYQIIDTKNPNNWYNLTSNFMGSKYHMEKDGITYMTVSFRMGCGQLCRHLDIYSLRERAQWESLQGHGWTSDLEQLYSKGNNFQHISRLTNLEPAISRTTGQAILHFSRKAVVPCVQNMIVCNLNGQKVLQLIKVNELDNIFEVCLQRKMEMEKVLGLLVASFDLKLGIE